MASFFLSFISAKFLFITLHLVFFIIQLLLIHYFIPHSTPFLFHHFVIVDSICYPAFYTFSSSSFSLIVNSLLVVDPHSPYCFYWREINHSYFIIDTSWNGFNNGEITLIKFQQSSIRVFTGLAEPKQQNEQKTHQHTHTVQIKQSARIPRLSTRHAAAIKFTHVHVRSSHTHMPIPSLRIPTRERAPPSLRFLGTQNHYGFLWVMKDNFITRQGTRPLRRGRGYRREVSFSVLC